MRVIGGSERGRRLRAPKGRDVRPTPDRVRETLFNWLQGELEGVTALDLFAGSGALGIEALSRGAGQVTFVESARPALAALQENLTLFGRDSRIRLVRASAWQFLAGFPERAFELVFLDPPYGRGWVLRAGQTLEGGGWLTPAAWVYVEAGREEDPVPVPENWQPYREGTCGEVAYRLYRRRVPAAWA